MKGKKRLLRIAISSVLLTALFAVGVTVMQLENQEKKKEIQKELAQLEEQEKQEASDTAEETEPDVNADTDQVEAEIPESIGHLDNQEIALNEEESQEAEIPPSTAEPTPQKAEITPEETPQEVPQDSDAEETVQMEEESVESANLNFTDGSTLSWPVEGQVLIDYSMDSTVYFPTLDQYRYSPAMYIQSTIDTPVTAAAEGTIVNIEETYHTGNTVTMDLGNGYQAIYGFLKNMEKSAGETVAAGEVIGYIDEPRAEYAAQESGLYFAMRLNGDTIDPVLQLPTEE